MITSPFYLISIAFSTLLAFFTMAALVEISLNAMDRNKYRTRFLMRLIPYVTLLLDRIFGCFSLGNWFNPLNCESCVQKVVLEAYYPDLKMYLSENELSLLRHLSIENSHIIFGVVFFIFFGISFFKLVQVVYQTLSMNRALQGLKNHSKECFRTIENRSLKKLIMQYQVKIWVTSEVSGPMVAWNRDIYFPEEFASGLDQRGFESILAHEMEHVRWKDSWINLALRGIAAVFWWIPMESWYRSVDQDQEMACDAKVVRYDLEQESLASALVKVSKELKCKSLKAFCYFARSSGRTKSRLDALLSDATPYKITGYYCLTVLLATLILSACYIYR